jgi:hypothetical protein
MAIKISGTTVIDDTQGLRITGVSTFTAGPVLVGTATSTGTVSQPLQVSGGAYVSSNVGIGATNPTSILTVQGDVLVSGATTTNSLSLPNNSFLSGILTTSSTLQVSLAAFSTSTYRSVKMNVQVSYGSTHKRTELLVIHDGIETFFTEYGTVVTSQTEYEPLSLATFTSDLNSGNFRILVTPQYSGSTTIKYLANLFTI